MGAHSQLSSKIRKVGTNQLNEEEIKRLADEVEDYMDYDENKRVQIKYNAGWKGRLPGYAKENPRPVPQLNGVWAEKEKGYGTNYSRVPRESAPMWVLELPVYKELITRLQSQHVSKFTTVDAPTGTGKTIGTIAALLTAFQGLPMKVLYCLPNRLAAKQAYETFLNLFFGSKKILVGIVTGDITDYESGTNVLIVTPGIAMILMANELTFTHVVLDEAHERSLQTKFVFHIVKEQVGQSTSDVQVLSMTASSGTIQKLVNYFPGSDLLTVSGALRQFKTGIIFLGKCS